MSDSAGQGAQPPGGDARNGGLAIELLGDVEVEVTVEIGRRRTRIGSLLSLTPGQLLELGKAAGEPLDIYVNGKLLGRGEAIVVGNNYGVRITELISPGNGRTP
jgi:flagellar motor switch protein FliN/FliY